jgi:ribosomal protein L34
MIVPKTKSNILDRVRRNVLKKKETMVYEVRVNPETGKKVLKRRPK